MRAVYLIGAIGISLCACASNPNQTPPVCDGKHTRPANLYGSVLSDEGDHLEAPPIQPPPSHAPPNGGAGSPSIKPLSAIDPQSFAPCGRLA